MLRRSDDGPMAKRVAVKEAPEAKRSSDPRPPRREKGFQRYRELLDALERLLATRHPDDVGIYQIAEEANAPTASAYHFFPTKDAAFVALAQRYLEWFQRGMHDAVEASAFAGWLDLVARDSAASAQYLNAHPGALKLLTGRHGGMHVRQVEIRHNRQVGQSYIGRIKAAFALPDIPDAASKFHTMLEIQDAIWAISFVRHGEITEAYSQEAIRACRAYLRCYYPETLALTEDVARQLASGADRIQPSGWANLAADTEPDGLAE